MSKEKLVKSVSGDVLVRKEGVQVDKIIAAASSANATKTVSKEGKQGPSVYYVGNLKLASDTPQDAFREFNIIERCVQLGRVKGLITSMPATADGDRARKLFELESSQDLKGCESFSERQRADRTQLAEKAARAGVAGAAFAYFAAGPNGQTDDLVSRPNDPAVSAWITQAIGFLQTAAETGDVDAIAQLVQVYSGQWLEEKDFAKMLGYSLALEAIQSARGNQKAVVQLSKVNTYLEAKADGSELALANELKSSIIRKCCQSR